MQQNWNSHEKLFFTFSNRQWRLGGPQKKERRPETTPMKDMLKGSEKFLKPTSGFNGIVTSFFQDSREATLAQPELSLQDMFIRTKSSFSVQPLQRGFHLPTDWAFSRWRTRGRSLERIAGMRFLPVFTRFNFSSRRSSATRHRYQGLIISPKKELAATWGSSHSLGNRWSATQMLPLCWLVAMEPEDQEDLLRDKVTDYQYLDKPSCNRFRNTPRTDETLRRHGLVTRTTKWGSNQKPCSISRE